MARGSAAVCWLALAALGWLAAGWAGLLAASGVPAVWLVADCWLVRMKVVWHAQAERSWADTCPIPPHPIKIKNVKQLIHTPCCL